MQASGLPLHEWLAQLETYSPHEIDLGLERVDALLDRLRLQLPARVLHVAGTNGKGSSVAMLEALLRRSDAKVGSYTSPHMQRYNERIRIDGQEASDAQIVTAFESIEALRGDLPLTYFEFGTLAALVVFARSDVDIAVLEVGLGGRLDAVNAVEPSASLITNVSLDHCAWLGDDIETIAVEKAGIMRANKPVVFAAKDIPQAIVAQADALGADLYAATQDYRWSVKSDGCWSWQGISHSLHDLARPSLQGDIQIQNAAGVLTLLEVAGFDELLQSDVINAALGDIQLAGRMQIVRENWIVDVAHNPAAADVLADALRARASGGVAVAILGMLDDKDVEGVVTPLAGLVGSWVAVTADNPRAIPAAELARRVANSTGNACLIAATLDAAIERAEERAGAAGSVLVTGSFYTVGAALAAIDGLAAIQNRP